MSARAVWKFPFLVAAVMLLIPALAWSDAANGAIFSQNPGIQQSNTLVIHYTYGPGGASSGSFTLSTGDSALQTCGAPDPCVDAQGNAVAKSPNQGFWTDSDVGPRSPNAVYEAGEDTGFSLRNFFAFDVKKFQDYLQANSIDATTVTITSATLDLMRFGHLGTDDYVGINFNPLFGSDSNGNPITAYALTDVGGAFDANYYTALGGPSNGAMGAYGTGVVFTTDPAASPTDILAFALPGATSDLTAAVTLGPDTQNHNFFVIGGSTFDATAPVPSVPEPASLALVAFGLTGLIARRKK